MLPKAGPLFLTAADEDENSFVENQTALCVLVKCGCDVMLQTWLIPCYRPKPLCNLFFATKCIKKKKKFRYELFCLCCCYKYSTKYFEYLDVHKSVKTDYVYEGMIVINSFIRIGVMFPLKLLFRNSAPLPK